jgi:predicted RNA binding protein YcfA (HicA-like mRNA interferase family)
MPKKIRELKQILRQAGFIELMGKGTHTNWMHPNYPGKLTISGQDGADAKSYQDRDVRKAIEEAQKDRNLEENDEAPEDEV